MVVLWVKWVMKYAALSRWRSLPKLKFNRENEMLWRSKWEFTHTQTRSYMRMPLHMNGLRAHWSGPTANNECWNIWNIKKSAHSDAADYKMFPILFAVEIEIQGSHRVSAWFSMVHGMVCIPFRGVLPQLLCFGEMRVQKGAQLDTKCDLLHIFSFTKFSRSDAAFLH